MWALSIPLSLEKSTAPHEEFAEDEDDEDEELALENEDNELQDDKATSSLPSLEHVSISFLEISFMERVNSVSAVSGSSIKAVGDVAARHSSRAALDAAAAVAFRLALP